MPRMPQSRLGLVAAAAAASGLLLGQGASSTAASGRAPEIVFGRSGDIHVSAANGRVRRLTSTSAFDGSPSWSPDKSRIVFVRTVKDDPDVWVMNADGTNARRLAGSATGAADRYPRFSPDGRLIAFASGRLGADDVYVMRADGTGLRRLTKGPRNVDDTQPGFSADGRHVVFASNRASNYAIYRVRSVDGGGVARLTFRGSDDGARGDDISPSYSPDGKRIVFVSDRRGGSAVWTMNARGGDLREVARHEGHGVVFPRFSPDGRSIVYTAFPSGGTPGGDAVWTVEADGSGRTRLGPGSSGDWR